MLIFSFFTCQYLFDSLIRQMVDEMLVPWQERNLKGRSSNFFRDDYKMNISATLLSLTQFILF